jgi:hypothetical protein
MEGGVDTEEDFLRVERLLLVAQGNGGD